MAESIEIQILERIKKAGRAVLFFVNNFLSSGNAPFDKFDRVEDYSEAWFSQQFSHVGNQ